MDAVLQAVHRSNQRGGRMLSVCDLIEAGTLTPPFCAWLLGRIERGASWMVGARPGGAGKTTIMSALLAMLPPGEAVVLTRPGTGWETSPPGTCLVAYEIGPGRYDAYIWGRAVREFAACGVAGCRLVTNLHADTLEQARAQIVGDCGASEEECAAFGLFLPVTRAGGRLRPTPCVRSAWAAEGGAWRESGQPARPAPRERAIESFLNACMETGDRTVEAVRAAWLAWLGDHPAPDGV